MLGRGRKIAHLPWSGQATHAVAGQLERVVRPRSQRWTERILAVRLRHWARLCCCETNSALDAAVFGLSCTRHQARRAPELTNDFSALIPVFRNCSRALLAMLSHSWNVSSNLSGSCADALTLAHSSSVYQPTPTCGAAGGTLSVSRGGMRCFGFMSVGVGNALTTRPNVRAKLPAEACIAWPRKDNKHGGLERPSNACRSGSA